MNRSEPQKISQVCISLMTIFFMLFSPIGNGIHPVIANAPASLMAAVNTLELSNLSLYENSAPSSPVGLFSVTPPNEAYVYTYTLVDGDGSTDNGAFTISSDSLNIIASPDYESKNSYAIRVRASDNQPVPTLVENTFTITIIDLNEAPTDILLSNLTMDENVPAGSVVGTLTPVDPDQTAQVFTYNLFGVVNPDGSSNDNASFSISGSTLKINASPNYEVKASYSVLVQVLDSGAPAMNYEKVFTLTVNDLNEKPTSLSLSANTIVENAPENARTIGTFSATDPDLPTQTLTYSLVVYSNGTPYVDNAAFAIVGDTLSIKAAPDYETKKTYQIMVRVTDSGSPAKYLDLIFPISVTNVGEPATVYSFNKSSLQEKPIYFNWTDFSFHFQPSELGGTTSLEMVKITGLPAHGALRLGSGPTLTAGAEIPIANLDTLTYTSDAGYGGSDSFAWNARNSLSYAASDAQVLLTIAGLPKRSFVINPLGDAKSSDSGKAKYNILLANTGEVSDSYTLALEGVNPWTTTITPAHLSNLAPRTGAQFTIYVEIPADTPKDAFAVSQVKIVSDADPAIATVLKLTTTNAKSLPQPMITSLNPAVVVYPIHSKYSLSINGINFSEPMQVTIGGQPVNARTANNTLIIVDVPFDQAVGDYSVQVCNSYNLCFTAFAKFSVLSLTPRLFSVHPNWGYTNTPNPITVEGLNLSQASFSLIGSTQTVVPLQPTSVTETQAQIEIPAGLPADTYILQVCIQGKCDPAPHTYAVLEGSGNDFSASNEDLTAIGTLREGSIIAPTLYVHRLGGDGLLAAEVDFYRDAPYVPANKLISSSTRQMRAGEVATASIQWKLPAGLTGTVKIFAVIDPRGLLTETSTANNVVSQTLTILPREKDEIAPVIQSFKIVGEPTSTTNPVLNFELIASDTVVDGMGGVYKLNMIERTYNAAVKSLVVVRETNWFPYYSKPSYVLSAQPGLHVIQVTVSDQAGNSATAEVSINYDMKATIGLAIGQVIIYSMETIAGTTNDLSVTTLTGDADLYVWDPDGNLVDASLKLNQALDALSLQPQLSGRYLVEVVANQPTTCTVNLGGPIPASLVRPPAWVQTGEKVMRQHPGILLNNAPQPIIPSTPAPIAPTYMTYLPVLSK